MPAAPEKALGCPAVAGRSLRREPQTRLWLFPDGTGRNDDGPRRIGGSYRGVAARRRKPFLSSCQNSTGRTLPGEKPAGFGARRNQGSVGRRSPRARLPTQARPLLGEASEEVIAPNQMKASLVVHWISK